MFWKKPSELETKQRPTQRIDYPSGTAVDTEDGVYFIKSNKRFKVFSNRVLDSWRFTTVYGSRQAIKHFTYTGYLGFRDGSLIKDISTSKIYLISDNRRRHIKTPDLFEKLGFDTKNIVLVAEQEAGLHDEGEPIDAI
jgi:hypothetical protein